ncbi:MAG TPA: hypothetical protein VML75_05110, partial [Kofleriaceae bacterium]|nr:hypothetical protein [Kofleriaceae bacterium]
MPLARNTPAQTVQHVICRYHGRQIFVTEPLHRTVFLERFEHALKRTDWVPLAFALMGNHNHAAWWAERAALRSFYHPLNSAYARWMNRRLSPRIGSFFAGRPQNITFDPARTAHLIAYIHNNPVRAGAARDPEGSSWTSHRAFIGEAPAPPWLNVERALDLCGFDATPSGRLGFHEFVCARASGVRDEEMSGGKAQRVRKDVRAAAGSSLEIEQTVSSDRVSYGVLARPDTPLRRRWTGSPRAAAAWIARQQHLDLEDLRCRDRRRTVVEARRLALLTWTRYLDAPMCA